MSIRHRLFPRGLYGRAALILLVPVVTMQLVFSTEFIQRHYEGVTRQMTQGVALDLRLILAEIAASADLDAARAAVAEVAEALEIDLVLPAGPDAPRTDQLLFFDLSGQAMVETLRAQVPGLVAADVTRPQRMVSLRIATPLGEIEAQVPRRRMSATNPHQLLVLMVFTAVLMTVIAFWFLRNQLRPITKLAQAAEDFGKGRTVAYRPRGALEVRAAGRAFLDMRARIERHIEQRTLVLSGVSHDLRTPLTRLKLGLTLLPESPEIAALQADVAQMDRMVEEFLAFVRGDAMEGFVRTDAEALVRSVAGHAGPAVAVRGVTGVAAPVEMRPEAVTRAVDNLVANARRFAERVEISLDFREGSLLISVEDNGPGIPEDLREVALRPFTRLEAARDPNQGGGVGLGLSIASDIALSHGGALRLSQSDRLGGLRADLTLAR
ncbi:MAG: two-component sensor histidine kinase [Rhodobacterales bacterium 32-66-7]|nr:MAG: two-component sensor histidine kinase [Rhodobacterales bacterium 12-65-15]OYX25701.1 MAG: two-component sensor histidine kinase [Rhodobacterales bacterium 32-66-7]